MKKFIKRLVIITGMLVAGYIFGWGLATTAKAQEMPLLWKIEGKKLKAPSYLYGTLHIMCKDDFVFPANLEKVIQSATKVVLELDVDDPQLMQKMQMAMINPGMKNFSTDMNEEDKEIVNAFFVKNYGADLSQLGVIKPFALMSMVIQKSVTCDSTSSYELSMVQAAAKKGIEVIGLETVEYQMAIFDEEPLEKQIEILVNSVKDFEESKVQLSKMMEIYLSNDLNRLWEFGMESPDIKGLEDVLLFERNRQWIPRMEEYIRQGSVVFGVGALHLPGEQGVIELLKKQGYKVTPVLN